MTAAILLFVGIKVVSTRRATMVRGLRSTKYAGDLAGEAAPLKVLETYASSCKTPLQG